MRNLLQSVRHTLRSLRRHPSYTLPALVTLALGLASVAVVTAVLRATIFAPLPFPRGNELVTLDVESTKGYSISLSIPNFEDWQQRNRSFAHIAMGEPEGMMLSTHGSNEVVNTEVVLGDWFETLEARLLRGRPFAGPSTGKGAPPEAVLSFSAWQRRFGGAEGILGQPVVLDGKSYTVVGVLADGQNYPGPETEFFIPMGVLAADRPWEDRDSSFGAQAVARLRPGVTLAAAHEDMQRVWREVNAKVGKKVARPIVLDLRSYELGDKATSARLAGLAVLLLWGLGTANALHLALARAQDRQTELGVRAALGAGRGAQFRLLALEAGFLALFALLLGLGLAAGALRAAAAWLAGAAVPVLHHPTRLDGGVFAATALLALLSAAVLTLAPALQLLSRRATAAATRQRRRGPARAALMITEVAATVVLVALASLLGRSETLLGRVDKGFDATGVYAALVASPDHHFKTEEGWQATYQRVVDAARRLPGVEHAAVTLTLPLSHRSWEMDIMPGAANYSRERADSVLFNLVSDDSFATLGIPILRGRGFTPSDRAQSQLVAVIDETMARRYWPNGDALGQQVIMEAPAKDHQANAVEVRTVVGIARNVRHYKLEEPSRIQVYVPLAQSNGRYDINLELAVRGSLPPAGLESELRQAMAAVDPELTLVRAGFMERFVDAAYGPRRALGRVFAAFGLLALLLAAAGVFAVMTHSVSTRYGELGIRSALGANAGNLLLHVLRAALLAGAAGAVAGCLAGAASSLALRSLLFGVGAFDARSQLLSAGVVLLAVGLAALAPALRAARVQPARLLAAGDRAAR